MIKKAGIVFCLLAFTFQAVFFNVFLYGFILSVKTDESKFSEGLQSLSFTQKQYKKLQWLNSSEFVFGSYLFDVKEIKKQENKTILLCKVDLKEKDFSEKLVEHTKNNKNKKAAGFSFVFKISDPYKINFLTQAKKIIYKKIVLSIPENTIEKSSPPPKA